MNAFVASFRLPKGGNAPEEIEDAHYPRSIGQHRAAELRCAVADGATEGMLAGPWAEILVKTFGRSRGPATDVLPFLQRSSRSWTAWKRNYLAERERRNKPIQWYEDAGLRAGAFATFLGLSLRAPPSAGGGAWDAVAIGDSCLFQIRDGRVLNSFPLTSSPEFSSRPYLLPTNPSPRADPFAAIKTIEGDWRSDDTFLLMTDALARWFLEEYETGGSPWITCRDLDPGQPTGFQEWVRGLRTTNRMRNDDVTLLRIDIG